MKIYPSIASSNPLLLSEELSSLGDWDYLHIDIEDGNFTPNITFGMTTVEAICKETKSKNIQVHLMVNNPLFYLSSLRDFGVTEVFAHVEALDDPELFIRECHDMKMTAGLALKADSPISYITNYEKITDSFLFLTSKPSPIKEVFSDVAFKKALEAASSMSKKVRIFADGKLNEKNLQKLSMYGFYGAVLGGLIFSFDNRAKKLIDLSILK